MLSSISASNGGGHVKDEEFCESLGAYMLVAYGGLSPRPLNAALQKIPNYEDEYLWTFKGKVYRVLLIKTPVGTHLVERLHFDYYREDE